MGERQSLVFVFFQKNVVKIMVRRFAVPLRIGLVASMLLLAGCDGDNKEGEALSEETLAELSSMMTDVSTVMGMVMARVQVGGKQVQAAFGPEDIFACPQGGQVDYDGSSSSSGSVFTFDLAMTFENCNGIDGSLSVSGDGAISEQVYEYAFSMDGELREVCTIGYDQFEQRIVTNIATQEFSISLDGSISGRCGNESFTCNMDGVTFDQNSSAAAYQNVCRSG
ncbi:hypothetical protein GQ464_016875 [Rhodocaloribacter litoris]|uniref:hypothetical protein n=1 Tax=Rhodocaloribacter litoris TaxID=2558931 RepID=UPI001421E629|nr:hypothetical protein [Rhodocaloribacter litoris]QXD15059.1 hypothetical protein GQ464_016875 [Rhodocaloribacter litoris]